MSVCVGSKVDQLDFCGVLNFSHFQQNQAVLEAVIYKLVQRDIIGKHIQKSGMCDVQNENGGIS